MTKTPIDQHKSLKYKAGIIVLLILAVLTAIEFGVSQLGNWIAVLLVISLLKAFLVIRDFMHIGKLFAGEDE
jgi:hypothetical protein